VIRLVEVSGRQMDVEYYNGLSVTSEILLAGNLSLRDNGDSEICFAKELPHGWHTLGREAVRVSPFAESGTVRLQFF
jgi:hypothetical protein